MGRKSRETKISETHRLLTSYLCRSIAWCKTTRGLKGNSLVSPPWCGYLVHIFGIFDCSYNFGTRSLVHIWYRKGEEPPLTIFWRQRLRAIPCVFTSVLHCSLAVIDFMAEAKRKNKQYMLLCLCRGYKKKMEHHVALDYLSFKSCFQLLFNYTHLRLLPKRKQRKIKANMALPNWLTQIQIMLLYMQLVVYSQALFYYLFPWQKRGDRSRHKVRPSTNNHPLREVENLATEAKIQILFYSLKKTLLVNRFQK